MISEEDKRKYLQILNELNRKHANIFTQKQLAEHLNVSTRTIHSFKAGKIFNFWLLVNYAAIIGIKVHFLAWY